eukprot:jgi/Hompol1/3582/HPOL_006641-RA
MKTGDLAKGVLRPGAEDERGLMEDEERFVGHVEFVTYTNYIRAAGGIIFVFFTLLFTFSFAGFNVTMNLYLTFWSTNALPAAFATNSLKYYALPS